MTDNTSQRSLQKEFHNHLRSPSQYTMKEQDNIFTIVVFGLALGGLFITGVGSPIAEQLIADQGNVAATIGLAGCFYDF